MWIVCRVNEAQSRPRREYTPRPRPSYDYGEVEESNGGYAPAASSPPAYSPGKLTFLYVFHQAATFPMGKCLNKLKLGGGDASDWTYYITGHRRI